MIAVIQRVKRASVVINEKIAGECEKGLMILLGVADGDTKHDAELLASKISKLRIFSDENGKMNLSLGDIGGGVLIVSNFTLGANYSHGNRPDFMASAHPSVAEPLYEHFVSLMRERVSHVATGVFGADMSIDMTADGPVTVVMDSEKLKKRKSV